MNTEFLESLGWDKTMMPARLATTDKLWADVGSRVDGLCSITNGHRHHKGGHAPRPTTIAHDSQAPIAHLQEELKKLQKNKRKFEIHQESADNNEDQYIKPKIEKIEERIQEIQESLKSLGA